MINREHELPLSRQAELLSLSGCSLYYEPQPVPAAELAVMRQIDELHLNHPFAGSRMLRDLLRAEGVAIGRDLVATLMRRMGYRGALPATKYIKTCFWAQDPSVLTARARDRSAELCLSDGHHVHPDGARVCLPGRRAGLGD